MCFLLGATGTWTENGDALIASITDVPYDVRTVTKVERPADGLPYLGVEFVSINDKSLFERGLADVDVEGAPCRGVNEAGLSFSEACGFERAGLAETPPPSIMEGFDGMLRNCATVDEAIAFLEAWGPSSYATSLLIADGDGVLAQVELGTLGIALVDRHTPEDPGMLIVANCFVSLGGTADVATLDNHANNNLCRVERGQQLGEALRGKISVESLRRVLSDHGNITRDPAENPLAKFWGYSICNHGTRGDYKPEAGEDEPAWGTVSAEILEPAARRLHFAYGWACGAPPEYDDQLLQGRSWGWFAPFQLDPDSPAGLYSTTHGDITALGARATAAGLDAAAAPQA